MQNGILTLFGVCIALGMGELLLPDEESATSRRLLRFLASLAVILTILTPFVGFLQENKDFTENQLQFEEGDIAHFEQIFEQAVLEQSGEDLKAGLAALLEKEYGIAAQSCEILVYFEPDGALARVSIFLSGEALATDPLELSESLSKRLGCRVEVR